MIDFTNPDVQSGILIGFILGIGVCVCFFTEMAKEAWVEAWRLLKRLG